MNEESSDAEINTTSAAATIPAWAQKRLVWGAVLMGVAVALGAFGAHGLKSHTDAQGLAIWETAVRYQTWHALALLVLSVAWDHLSPKQFRAATMCMLVGIFIFSGSLYVLVLSGIKWLGAITPIGGVLFIIGWILTVIGAVKQRN